MKTNRTMIPGDLKFQSVEDFVKYRNYLIDRGTARTKTMNDNRKNYYFYRLEHLDKLNPEFAGLGKIIVKEHE